MKNQVFMTDIDKYVQGQSDFIALSSEQKTALGIFSYEKIYQVHNVMDEKIFLRYYFCHFTDKVKAVWHYKRTNESWKLFTFQETFEKFPNHIRKYTLFHMHLFI